MLSSVFAATDWEDSEDDDDEVYRPIHHGIYMGGSKEGVQGAGPPFGPRCRLFDIGHKVGPPPGPPLLIVDLRIRWTPVPFQKSWIRP